MEKTYLFVDGESHYLMSEKCLKGIRGEDADLSSLCKNHYVEAKFFWDKHIPQQIGISPESIHRRIYFTTFTGTPGGLQEARVKIREAEFEPQVIPEEKDLSKQRENRLKKDGLIIKAKGADVALAVRMLEDAYHGNYDWCLLATSDIDYLPVIEAVRRMGKHVIVFGYPQGIAKDSPFLYIPEKFYDLEQVMKQYRN